MKSLIFLIIGLIVCCADSTTNAININNNPRVGPCNIPIEENEISQKDFLEKYAYKSPVIFRQLKDSKRNHEFREACQLSNLIEKFGQKFVIVGTANTYSYARYSMRLSDYINKYVVSDLQTCNSMNEFCNRLDNNANDFESSNSLIESKLKYGNETWYFFGENNYTEWKSLFDVYERPIYNLPMHDHAYSFGIASIYTGVPFHFHGPGFAETVWGRKRWFLYEPNKKPHFDPDKSTLQWFLEEYGNLKEREKPFECILNEFDVIYFPDKWWHATLNLDPVTIFMSTFLSSTFN